MKLHSWVRVKWVDSRHGESEWQFMRNVEPKVCRCVSVGYVVHVDKKIVALAQSVADLASEYPQCSGAITIPRCAITKVQRLKEPF